MSFPSNKRETILFIFYQTHSMHPDISLI